MARFFERPAAAVHQGVKVTAGLCALSAVAAAPADGVAQVALPAVTDAQGAVDEGFQLESGLRADGVDLLQLSSRARMTRLNPTCSRNRTRSGEWLLHLRAGKKGDGRQVAFEQPCVLDDEGVGTAFMDLTDEVSAAGISSSRSRVLKVTYTLAQ